MKSIFSGSNAVNKIVLLTNNSGINIHFDTVISTITNLQY